MNDVATDGVYANIKRIGANRDEVFSASCVDSTWIANNSDCRRIRCIICGYYSRRTYWNIARQIIAYLSVVLCVGYLWNFNAR